MSGSTSELASLHGLGLLSGSTSELVYPQALQLLSWF